MIMKLKQVTTKTGADGKAVDRSIKNVALTDEELELIIKVFNGLEYDWPFDFEQELLDALEHPMTVFEA